MPETLEELDACHDAPAACPFVSRAYLVCQLEKVNSDLDSKGVECFEIRGDSEQDGEVLILATAGIYIDDVDGAIMTYTVHNSFECDEDGAYLGIVAPLRDCPTIVALDKLIRIWLKKAKVVHLAEVFGHHAWNAFDDGTKRGPKNRKNTCAGLAIAGLEFRCKFQEKLKQWLTEAGKGVQTFVPHEAAKAE